MEPGTHDASRRTYLAEERTLLAWWRSGLAAFAVAVGVGRLLPALLEEDGEGPFVVLGVAYALLGLGLVLFGSLRERAQVKALAEGGFAPLSRALVTALTAYRPCSGSPRSPSFCRSERWLHMSPPRTSRSDDRPSLLRALTEVVPIEDPEDRSGR